MAMSRNWWIAGGAALAVVGAAMSPVFGAPRAAAERPVRLSARGGIGSFTPAAADPRVAASLARAGMGHSGFRFTPAAIGTGTRSVTVAVRAASNVARGDATRSNVGAVTLTPIAYNLGVAVGWKRFALSGDVARIDTAGTPGSRERVDLGLSYNAPRWSGRIQVERDRPMDPVSKLTGGQSTSFDLGGSYRIARNIDVTAGVRYRAEDRDRLKLVDDRRRDAQAVYIGTAFKF